MADDARARSMEGLKAKASELIDALEQHETVHGGGPVEPNTGPGGGPVEPSTAPGGGPFERTAGTAPGGGPHEPGPIPGGGPFERLKQELRRLAGRG